MHNAIKHSAARAVNVHLQGDRDGLVLTVTDDGKGFDISTVWGRGLGLISMQERLDASAARWKFARNRVREPAWRRLWRCAPPSR